MRRYSYVNGEVVPHEEARVSIDDRGYQFSDGVYEVILVSQGHLVDWEPHFKRLQSSLAGIRIVSSYDSNELQSIIQALLQKNQLHDGIVYIQITRGVALRNHNFPKKAIDTACVITVAPLVKPSGEAYAKGVAVKSLPDLRWKRRDLKTIGLLANVLAKEEAAEAGADEALLVEEDGTVTEGSSSNFFWVDRQGCLWTHPATSQILNGITRQVVLRFAKEAEITVNERHFSLTQLLEESVEAFITSTTKLILPVTRIDTHQLGKVGQNTQQLMAHYQEYVETYGD